MANQRRPMVADPLLVREERFATPCTMDDEVYVKMYTLLLNNHRLLLQLCSVQSLQVN